MSISRISIKNYKSLKDIRLNLDNKYQIFGLLGKNGAGKSNVIDAINYFYENLNNDSLFGENKIDKVNVYAQFMQIEIVYDFSVFKNKNKNEHLKDVYEILKKYSRKNKILIRMIQYKNGKIEWFPKEKEVRKSISKLYPLYLIDTRFINLQDWSYIWNMISDLAITTEKLKQDMINGKLDLVFKEIYGEKYTKSLNIINNIFKNEKININNLDYKNRFKNAISTRLGGVQFINDGNDLQYYSDGINSLKYINLAMKVISMLSNTGWKSPIILLDEPEIGLHTQYIYNLVDNINEVCNNNINIIISTHSNQLITRMIQSEIRLCLYSVYARENYSDIDKLKDIIYEEEKFIISNKETECYFADAIVCVEGRTEIQILRNKRINELFKKIRNVIIYQSNSDNLGIKLIDPSNIKFNIPYLNIKDMDKILSYDKKENKFTIKKEKENPLYNNNLEKKQKFMYISTKKDKVYFMKKYIKNVLNSITFKISNNKSYIDDTKFDKFISDIKKYCLMYNTYSVRTTIEGCIVNDKNVDIVLKWLKDNKLESNTYEKLQLLIDNRDIRQKSTILRLCLNGKFDTFENHGKIKNEMVKNNKDIYYSLKKEDYDIIDKIKSQVGKKTSGWIGDFLEYYFKNNIDKLSTDEQKLERFKHDFEELTNILQIISNMVK